MNRSLGGIALLNPLKWNRVALMVCVGITVGCSEALPIAGGALEGQVTAIPGAWGPVARDEIIQLETNGPDGPYSVNLWTVAIDGDLHVFAGITMPRGSSILSLTMPSGCSRRRRYLNYEPSASERLSTLSDLPRPGNRNMVAAL